MSIFSTAALDEPVVRISYIHAIPRVDHQVGCVTPWWTLKAGDMSARWKGVVGHLWAVVLGLGCLGAVALGAAQPMRAVELSVGNEPVAPGAHASVSGNFATGSCAAPYGLTWDGVPLEVSPVVTNFSSGQSEIDVDYVVPSDAVRGPHTLVATCSAGNVQIDTGQAWVSGVALSPNAGTAGSSFTVDGDYLLEDCDHNWPQNIAIRWDGVTLPWNAITGGSHRVASDAEFVFAQVTASMTVPALAKVGPHTVAVACGPVSPTQQPPDTFSVIWSAPFIIQAPPPPPPPSAPSARSSAVPPPSSTGPPPAPSSSPPPTVGPASPSPALAATAPPVAGGGPPTGAWPRPLQIAAIPPVQDLHPKPAAVGLVWLFVLALAFLLIAWPAELFNKTYEENESTIRMWLRLGPVPTRSERRSSWLVVLGFSIVAAALTSVGEPGPLRAVVVTAVALVFAIPMVSVGYGFTIESYVRRQAPHQPRAALRVVFPALVLAVGFAVVTHAFHFVPGYVYGLLLTYTVVGRRLTRRQEGMAVVRGVIVLAAIGVVAWCGWQFGTAPVAAGSDTPVGLRILDTTLGCIAMLSAESLVIGLLPIRFLDGAKIWRATWTTIDNRERRWPGRLLWLVVFTSVVTGYLVVLRGLGERTPSLRDMLTMTAVCAGFFVGSVAFWMFFVIRRRWSEVRWRPRTDTQLTMTE
jgi:hypothetical protein